MVDSDRRFHQEPADTPLSGGDVTISIYAVDYNGTQKPFHLDPEHLRIPFAMRNGEEIDLAEVIRHRAPQDVRQALGMAIPEEDAPVEIMTVDRLTVTQNYAQRDKLVYRFLGPDLNHEGYFGDAYRRMVAVGQAIDNGRISVTVTPKQEGQNPGSPEPTEK